MDRGIYIYSVAQQSFEVGQAVTYSFGTAGQPGLAAGVLIDSKEGDAACGGAGNGLDLPGYGFLKFGKGNQLERSEQKAGDMHAARVELA